MEKASSAALCSEDTQKKPTFVTAGYYFKHKNNLLFITGFEHVLGKSNQGWDFWLVFFFCWLLGFVVVFFFLIALRNGEEANVALVCKSAV